MSTALSHLCGLERGQMLSGSAESQTDADMLEAAFGPARAANPDKKRERRGQRGRGSETTAAVR